METKHDQDRLGARLNANCEQALSMQHEVVSPQRPNLDGARGSRDQLHTKVDAEGESTGGPGNAQCNQERTEQDAETAVSVSVEPQIGIEARRTSSTAVEPPNQPKRTRSIPQWMQSNPAKLEAISRAKRVKSDFDTSTMTEADREQRTQDIVNLGFGIMGNYCPNSYFYILCLTGSKGTVLYQALPLGVLTAAVGIVAHYYDLHFEDTAHKLLGFTLGFSLVMLGNTSHQNYAKATTSVNRMVQDGITICGEVLPYLKRKRGNWSEAQMKEERHDFVRLICLYFRLVCHEVRSDIQVKKSRYSWLSKNGGRSTKEEREKFDIATKRLKKDQVAEWQFYHPAGGYSYLGATLVPFHARKVMRYGHFPVTLRPQLVASWLHEKLDMFRKEMFIRSDPVHARMIAQLQNYTHHISTLVQVDRTPMPFESVHIAAVLVVTFCLSVPFTFQKEFGVWTPVVSFWIAMAYGGLYVNACNMRNPFNYEGTLTGMPINVFLQRLERVTEALLNDVDDNYGVENPQKVMGTQNTTSSSPPPPEKEIEVENEVATVPDEEELFGEFNSWGMGSKITSRSSMTLGKKRLDQEARDAKTRLRLYTERSQSQSSLGVSRANSQDLTGFDASVFSSAGDLNFSSPSVGSTPRPRSRSAHLQGNSSDELA